MNIRQIQSDWTSDKFNYVSYLFEVIDKRILTDSYKESKSCERNLRVTVIVKSFTKYGSRIDMFKASAITFLSFCLKLKEIDRWQLQLKFTVNSCFWHWWLICCSCCLYFVLFPFHNKYNMFLSSDISSSSSLSPLLTQSDNTRGCQVAPPCSSTITINCQSPPTDYYWNYFLHYQSEFVYQCRMACFSSICL